MSHAIDLELVRCLASRSADIVADWRTRLKAAADPRADTPAPELEAEMRAVLSGLGEVLEGGDDRFEGDGSHSLALALRAASEVRAARGFTPEETLLYMQAGKDSLQAVWQASAQDIERAHAGDQRIQHLMDRCVLVLASSFLAAREDVIKRQTESLREVSTPVITLWDSMLLLPLVGIVDSVRAQVISERLLEAISRNEAEVTLIDVTGVPVMDTSVARHILKTVAAAEMLGTRVILTGIGPSTAQTMVKLGIDMSGVPTRASLKSGLSLALTMTRRAIVERAPD